MAAGFVILKDGRCFSVPSAAHDRALRAVLDAMGVDEPLRRWLDEQLPSDGDTELGYAFVRKSDGEHVSRHLDLRGLTELNREVFEEAALDTERTNESDPALLRLRQMIRYCRAGAPPLELSDWTVEAPPGPRRIGPGWDDV
jgi:hypothetical protein